MDSARPRGRTRRKAVSCALAVRRETDGTSNLWVSRPSSKKGVSIRIFLTGRGQSLPVDNENEHSHFKEPSIFSIDVLKLPRQTWGFRLF